ASSVPSRGLASVSAIAAVSREALTGLGRVFGEGCAIPADPCLRRSTAFLRWQIPGSRRQNRLGVRTPNQGRSSHRRTSDLVESFAEPLVRPRPFLGSPDHGERS